MNAILVRTLDESYAVADNKLFSLHGSKHLSTEELYFV